VCDTRHYLGTKKSTPDDKFVIDACLSMCVDFSQLITSVTANPLGQHRWGNPVGATPLGSKPLPKLNPPRRSSFRDEKINRRWKICHWCPFITVCWFFAANNIRWGNTVGEQTPTKSLIIPFVIQLHCTILLLAARSSQLAARSSQLRSLVPVRVIRLPLPRVFTHFC